MIKHIAIEINPNLNRGEVLFYTNDNNVVQKLHRKRNYTLQMGNKRVTLRYISCVSRSSKSESMQVSLEIAQMLKIPSHKLTLQIRVLEDSKSIHIAPVIGIFVRRKKKQKTISKIQKQIVRQYLQHARELHYYAFAFCAEDIDWTKRTIQGYVLDENNRIIRRNVPFPDVMYDQNVSRAYEQQANVIKAMERLHQEIAFYFNAGYFNKWEIFEYVSNHDQAKKYHPPTVLLNGVSNIAANVLKHGFVYLKPINGSQGKGIITISRKNQHYEYKSQGSMLVEGKRLTKKQLEQYVSNTIKRRKYILQKGLALIRYKGRPVDIRVLMQKNEHGKWVRTKMFARVSKPGSITSNLSTGGEAKTVEEVLTANFTPNIVDAVSAKLRKAARVITKALEEKSEKLFGELGLDLGVTANGQIWLIEANSKPWKTLDTEAGSKELVVNSFRRPIEYAGYLVNTGK